MGPAATLTSAQALLLIAEAQELAKDGITTGTGLAAYDLEGQRGCPACGDKDYQGGKCEVCGHLPIEPVAKGWEEVDRDEKGRWASGGGAAAAGYQFYSPNIEENLKFDDAVHRLNTENQAHFHAINNDIDKQVGLDSIAYNAVGDWADGAENSLFTEIKGSPDYEAVRYSAAIKGALANQKAVIPFTVDPNGKDSVYRFNMNGTLSEIRGTLSKEGIDFRTLIPTKGGASVAVFDPGTAMHDTIERLAEHHGLEVSQYRGRGEFLGAETRSGANREYDKVIKAYEGSHSRRYERPSGHGISVSKRQQAQTQVSTLAKDWSEVPRDEHGRWLASAVAQHDSLKEHPARVAGARAHPAQFDNYQSRLESLHSDISKHLSGLKNSKAKEQAAQEFRYATTALNDIHSHRDKGRMNAASGAADYALAHMHNTILMLHGVHGVKPSEDFRKLAKADLPRDWQAPNAGDWMKRSYGGIVVNADNEFLVCQPADLYDGMHWTWPKGGLNSADEPPEAAAVREVREETGYTCEIIGYLPGTFTQGWSMTNLYLMRAVGPPGERDGEMAAVKWVPYLEAKELLGRSTNIVERQRDLLILQAAGKSLGLDRTLDSMLVQIDTKVRKDGASYVYKPEAEGRYQCDQCPQFIPFETGNPAVDEVIFRAFGLEGWGHCVFFSAQDVIKAWGTCSYWMLGAPDPDQESQGYLTKAEAGYVENKEGFGCKRCRFFDAAASDCQVVDKDSPGDTPGEILADACCGNWEAATTVVAGEDLIVKAQALVNLSVARALLKGGWEDVPRVPAGGPGGGQWTSSGGRAMTTGIAHPPNWHTMSPGQKAAWTKANVSKGPSAAKPGTEGKPENWATMTAGQKAAWTKQANLKAAQQQAATQQFPVDDYVKQSGPPADMFQEYHNAYGDTMKWDQNTGDYVNPKYGTHWSVEELKSSTAWVPSGKVSEQGGAGKPPGSMPQSFVSPLSGKTYTWQGDHYENPQGVKFTVETVKTWQGIPGVSAGAKASSPGSQVTGSDWQKIENGRWASAKDAGDDSTAAKALGQAANKGGWATLNTAEESAISFWSANGYMTINNQLRSNEFISVETLHKVASLDSALAKNHIPMDMITYRGFGGMSEKLYQLKPGGALQDNGFAATSTHKGSSFSGSNNAGESVRARVLIPAGTRGAYIKDWEHELLLARGSAFEFVSRETFKSIGGQTKHLVTVKVVQPQYALHKFAFEPEGKGPAHEEQPKHPHGGSVFDLGPDDMQVVPADKIPAPFDVQVLIRRLEEMEAAGADTSKLTLKDLLAGIGKATILLAEAEALLKYGTSEGAIASWDTRGRGRKEQPAGEHKTGLTLGDSKTKAYAGKAIETKTKLSKQEAGKLGENIIIAHLQQQGLKDARPLNAKVNNFPVDAIQDHGVIEIKTGLVSNGKSAQQWRATIGQPGKEETKWLKTLDPERKRAWNEKKAQDILARKNAAVEQISKQMGKPVKGSTMAVILNPDARTADIFRFSGFHLRIGWNTPEAAKGYLRTVKY